MEAAFSVLALSRFSFYTTLRFGVWFGNGVKNWHKITTLFRCNNKITRLIIYVFSFYYNSKKENFFLETINSLKVIVKPVVDILYIQKSIFALHQRTQNK